MQNSVYLVYAAFVGICIIQSFLLEDVVINSMAITEKHVAMMWSVNIISLFGALVVLYQIRQLLAKNKQKLD